MIVRSCRASLAGRAIDSVNKSLTLTSTAKFHCPQHNGVAFSTSTFIRAVFDIEPRRSPKINRQRSITASYDYAQLRPIRPGHKEPYNKRYGSDVRDTTQTTFRRLTPKARERSHSRGEIRSISNDSTTLRYGARLQRPKRRRLRPLRKHSTIRWCVKLHKRKHSLAIDIRRNYSRRIWELVRREQQTWWNRDRDYVFETVISAQPISQNDVTPKYSKFGRFLPSNPSSWCEADEIYKAWSARSWKGKAIWWRHALCFGLLFSPPDALKIIVDISRKSFLQIPGNLISDALLTVHGIHVAKADYASSKKPENYRVISQFHEAVCTYLRRYKQREGSAELAWPITRKLAHTLNAEHLLQFIDSVKKADGKLTIYTKLHLMYGCLEHNHVSVALDLFATFTKEELLNRATQSFCITCLTTAWKVDNGHLYRRQLTQYFLQKGILPDCQLRNVIMQNYLISGDKQSAWDMLEMIRKHKQTVDDYTYSIFLNHTPLEDTQTIFALYEMAMEDKTLERHKFLGGYFIYVAAAGRFAADENSFSALLSLYEDLYDATDLVEFGILDASHLEANPTRGLRLKQKPSKFATQWLLMSWVYENREKPETLMTAYNNFQFHIRNNHPRISPLAAKPHLATAFILALSQHKAYLQTCINILQDMLQPPRPTIPATKSTLEADPVDPNLPEYEKFLEPEEEDRYRASDSDAVHVPPLVKETNAEQFYYKVAPPSSHTWTALLNGLLRHGQYNAAEGILNAMRGAGVNPDLVTWKILINGYATRQKPESLRQALQDASIEERKPDLINIDVSAQKISGLINQLDKSFSIKNTNENISIIDVPGQPISAEELEEQEASRNRQSITSTSLSEEDLEEQELNQRARDLNPWTRTSKLDFCRD